VAVVSRPLERLAVIIFPAIDINRGRCVRLFQGDYQQVTVFSDSPAEVAARWQAEGATFLHLVDLDGAKAGRIVNADAIRAVAGALSIPVELGGGIRSLDAIARALDLGVARVILGTAAVEDRTFVADAVRRHGDRIVVGIDARDGLVATRGWTVTSSVRALDLAREMVGIGVSRFIYTDIHHDGTLTEPGYETTREMVDGVGASVIASGGVSRIEHLLRLAELGVEGAIVGRALYTGDVELRQALTAVGGTRMLNWSIGAGESTPPLVDGEK
jgi:phosphoribosylformimino-5-aminoimidazole carboxamide ribotide isomerase